MAVELVVFDIAGTTVADNDNVNDFLRKAFSNAGIIISKADADEVMGYRKREAIEILIDKYLPGVTAKGETIDAIHEDFTEQIIEFYETWPGLTALPFAEKVFHELQEKKIKVALNTGFTRAITDVILKKLRWQEASFIDTVICSDEVPAGRPHPYMIEAIMRRLDIKDAAAVAKVGDTRVDIEEGKMARCGIVIAVTTGAYNKEQLVKYQPDHIIDSLEFLPSLIS